MRGKVQKSLSEKTLRYPGYVEAIQTLKQCGLLGKKPVRVGDVEVTPRDLLLELLAEDLRLGPGGDILAMRVIVDGMKDGNPRRHTFELVDTYDPVKNHTAMARTTGFPATITARMIANEELREKGVFFPEQIFVGPRFESMLTALKEKGVLVTHND
jgi:lysine 6-dehydrogenase